MNRLCIKTKGNANPQGMPKVYFTCHPEDVRDTFDIIASDLLNAQNCAVCYGEDMSIDVEMDDMRDMNLFVIPITLRMLTDHSRAL